jgi:hypothetical protein
MIDVLASEGHFAAHVAAVYQALPEEHRGHIFAESPSAAAAFAHAGLTPSPAAQDNPMLVAAWRDLRKARLLRRTRVALMEHGAGQSYGGRPSSARNSSYAGGMNRDAQLFLHPNDHAAARDREAYPGAAVAVVGSPLLDTLPRRQDGSGPVVAFAFHFDLILAPETRTAFRWIRAELGRLAETREVLGHGHPRIIEQLAPWYRRAGIEVVRGFDDVCRRADVLVADNTSALFAFAATDRPVVVLNPPWYDRRIDHGLRFWEAAGVGVQVDEPGDLAAAVTAALEDAPAQRRARDEALAHVYRWRSGGAQRAAQALQEWAAEPRKLSTIPAHLSSGQPELAIAGRRLAL